MLFPLPPLSTASTADSQTPATGLLGGSANLGLSPFYLNVVTLSSLSFLSPLTTSLRPPALVLISVAP